MSNKKKMFNFSLLSLVVMFLINVISPTALVAAQSTMPDRPFIYLAQQNIGTIDPAKSIDETEIIAAVNLYEPLVFPERTDGSITPSPYLASEYEVSEDGQEYTFHLRDDVTFHSGNPLTAEDVVYSMERMLAIGQGNAWLWEGLFEEDGVTAVDESTVVFTLNRPYAPFLSSLLLLFIVDSELLKANEQDGDYGQAYLENNDAGSGPYTLSDWNREAGIQFVAFENYWQGWEDNKLQEIHMQFVSEEATTRSLLVSGQADMVNQYMNPSSYEEFKGAAGVIVDEAPSAMILELPMNTQKAPTDDINVRKAIASAFDYAVATEQILFGAEQAQGAVPINVDGHSDTVTVFEQNIEQAQEYLAQSSYAGEELTVTFMYLGDNPQQRQMSQLVTANLQAIGINVEVQPVTWPQVTEAAASSETTSNLTVISDSLKYPHVDSHTFGKYHPTAQGSYRSASWLEDEALTQILEEARGAIEVEEQNAKYTEAQDLISELAPAIFVSNNTHRIAFRDYVQNYVYVPLMGFDLSFYYLSVD